MSETRDAVAQAIAAVHSPGTPWTLRSEEARELFRRMADAAQAITDAEVAALREMAHLVEDGHSRWVQVADDLLPYLRGNPQPVTIDVRERPTMPRVLDLVVTRYVCPDCAALREDAARIEWLEASKGARIDLYVYDQRWRVSALSLDEDVYGPSLREAIDAARAGEAR